MDTTQTFFKICSRILTLFFICVFIITLHITFSYKMAYAVSTIKDIDFAMVNTYRGKSQLKIDIEQLFSFNNYNLKFDKLQPNILGETYFITKTIVIDSTLSKTYFTITLAHEITHLSYLTRSERYCHYNTFNKLYYSGDEYFKYCALKLAYDDLLGIVPDNYSFIGHLDSIPEFIY